MTHIPEIEFDHALARNRVIGYGSRIGSQSQVNSMFKRRILDSSDGAATFIAPTTKITGTLTVRNVPTGSAVVVRGLETLTDGTRVRISGT